MKWWVIARRDVASLFRTPVGYVVFAGLFSLAGAFWVAMVYTYAETSADLVFQPYAASTFTVTDHLLTPWFGNLVVLLLLVAPALAMRSFAEESRQGTLELLYASPVSTADIVVGKYLGVLAALTAILVPVGMQPLSMYAFGDLDLGALFAGISGCWLVGAAVAAWSVWWSSWTDNQIVAMVGGFAGGMGLWILAWMDPDPTSWFSRLSLATHADELVRGSVRLSDLVWFAAFIQLCLFGTWLKVDAHRWSA